MLGLTFILKLAGITGASIVSYSLATTIIREGPVESEYIIESTHPFLALFLELGAIAIIFFS